MVEIGIALSVCTQAYNAIHRGIGAGKEIAEFAGAFSKFFDGKETIQEAEAELQEGSKTLKFFARGSVEGRALEISMAKHKAAQQELKLRELIVLTVGLPFYEDMLLQRRRIRSARLSAARQRAARKAFYIDVGLITAMCAASLGAIFFLLSLVT